MKYATVFDILLQIGRVKCDILTYYEKSSKISLNEEPTLSSKLITLPKNYDALSLLQDTEHLDAFIAKSNTTLSRIEKENSLKSGHDEKKKSSYSKILQTRRLIRDMQVTGCLILELFLPKKFLALGKGVDLKSRYQLAKSLMDHEQVPHCIRTAVNTLLRPSFELNDHDRYITN